MMRSTGYRKLASAVALACSAASCGGMQSSLDPAAPEAASLARLTWIFIAVSTFIFVLVIAYLALALFRRRSDQAMPTPDPDPAIRRKLGRSIGIATGATTLTLVALLVSSGAAGHAISKRDESTPNVIRVTAYQWWWQVEYPETDVSKTVTTANEIHVPVGRSVRFELRSQDVIHSFWVPRLTGKIDVIPSRVNSIKILANEVGRFRGQCAEFCGYQHAHMAFWVVAEPEAEFEAWLEHQRAPAQAPRDERAEGGQRVFMSRPCVMCHAIAGTDAAATIGPDLTHLASRTTIAAGVLRNDGDRRRDWVAHAQSVKPGTRMPSVTLADDELTSLLAYLEGLQ
jgi:cytochrome c oxidase subunit 2